MALKLYMRRPAQFVSARNPGINSKLTRFIILGADTSLISRVRWQIFGENVPLGSLPSFDITTPTDSDNSNIYSSNLLELYIGLPPRTAFKIRVRFELLDGTVSNYSNLFHFRSQSFDKFQPFVADIDPELTQSSGITLDLSTSGGSGPPENNENPGGNPESPGGGITPPSEGVCVWPSGTLEALRLIPTLTRKHFVLYAGNLLWSFTRPNYTPEIYEITRITRCVAVSSFRYITSGLSVYVEYAVLCARDVNAANQGTDAGIFITTVPYHPIQYSVGPYDPYYGPDPNYFTGYASADEQEDAYINTIFKAELQAIKDDVDTFNVTHGATVRIIGVHVNQEGFNWKPSFEPGYAVWNAGLARKNNKIYNAIRNVFPTGASEELFDPYAFESGFRIFQYEFGTFYAQDQNPPFVHYYQDRYYNLTDTCEHHAVVLYEPHKLQKERATYDETARQKNLIGNTSKSLVVYTSLGSGWETLISPNFDSDFDYGLIHAYNMGAEMKGDTNRYTNPETLLDSVILYPEPFAADPATPLWGVYFLSYCRGHMGQCFQDDLAPPGSIPI